MGFEEVVQDYYHRISISPSEKRINSASHSDTVLHLPVIEWYASQCWHCTEFGVREANSTVALLRGCKGEVHSYDIERSPMVAWLYYRREELPCKWIFHQGNTADAHLHVGETDLLFIDTEHTYAHVKKELGWHGRKAKRFLIFHDTHTCWANDLTGNDRTAKGIGQAIEEFVREFPGEYKRVYETTWSNGLLVLERIKPTRRIFIPGWLDF